MGFNKLGSLRLGQNITAFICTNNKLNICKIKFKINSKHN